MVETPLMVSCGMDKVLVATNIETGELAYKVALPAAPLCMDIFGGYIAVGLFDGRLMILKAETGTHYSPISPPFDGGSDVDTIATCWP